MIGFGCVTVYLTVRYLPELPVNLRFTHNVSEPYWFRAGQAKQKPLEAHFGALARSNFYPAHSCFLVYPPASSTPYAPSTLPSLLSTRLSNMTASVTTLVPLSPTWAPLDRTNANKCTSDYHGIGYSDYSVTGLKMCPTGGQIGQQHYQPVTLYTSTSGPSHHSTMNFPASRPTAIYNHSMRGATPRPQQPQFGTGPGPGPGLGAFGYSAPVARRRTTLGPHVMTSFRQPHSTTAMMAAEETGVSEF
ncbi:unnamed protein product [Protopolystoma xenopodis]|uniref:Uncharacterized protein n=1 Tax=Protopolystoma xenopodis TaxID=117903 RepID=A0A3S5AIT4_9PLAT|nr:unnamed protein product [Protopolystoma xenopodis]